MFINILYSLNICINVDHFQRGASKLCVESDYFWYLNHVSTELESSQIIHTKFFNDYSLDIFIKERTMYS